LVVVVEANAVGEEGWKLIENVEVVADDDSICLGKDLDFSY